MSHRGVLVRISKEHAELLEAMKQKYCYPSFSSASARLMKELQVRGLAEELKNLEEREFLEKKKKKPVFDWGL